MTASNGHPPATKPPGGSSKASKVITLTVVGVVSVMVVGDCAAQNDDEVTADCVDMNNQFADGSYQVVDETSATRTTTATITAVRAAPTAGTTAAPDRHPVVRARTSYRPSDVRHLQRNGRRSSEAASAAAGSGGG